MKTSKDNIRFKIIFPFFIMTACFVAIMIFGVYRVQSNYLNKEIESKVNGADKLFAQLLAKESKFMIAQLEFIANDIELIKAWRTRSREELYLLASQIFLKINKKFSVTHFYFIEPDKTCFLRAHLPERYGDIITRHTMQVAANNVKITYGIELGPLGTFTLRVVYPWINNGRLLGYLELGEEIEHLTPQLKDISELDFIMTINKSNLERKKWEAGMKFLGKDNTWEDFESFVVIDKTVSTISPILKKIIQQNHISRVSSQNISDNNRMLRIAGTPLRDASGNKVGDIIALYDFTEQSITTRKTLKVLIFVTLAVVLILFIFYYIYSGHIERQVNAYRNNLEDLVAKRTNELNQAFDEIETLSGLLPICASCKKIRDDKGFWNQVETYIEKHSKAQFSHAMCEECFKKLYSGQDWYEKANRDGEITSS